MSESEKTLSEWRRDIKFAKENNKMVLGIKVTDLEALVDRAERKGSK
jgi:hypothetical protein